MKNIVLALILIFLSVDSISQDLSFARKVIDTLCSKEMYGRGYIKNGDLKAANYIENQFKEIGLKPLLSNYQQKFEFDINTFENEQTVSINNQSLILGENYILSPNTGNGIGKTKLLNYESFLKTKNLKKRGVYLKLNEYKKVLQNEELYKKLLTSKIIVKVNNTKLTASLSQSSLPIPIIEVLNIENEKFKKVKYNISSELKTNYQSQNIIGYIEGTNKTDSTLIYCAHYDHLGGMGDVFFPGANDNAAGIAMLIELAKYYKSNPHRYNIIFIAFGGEEVGLLGSKYFVENSPIDLTKIKFLMNLDLVGTGVDGITVVNGSVFKTEFEKLQKINENNNLLSQIKPRGKAANSDHYWFTEKGAPSFFIYAMGKPNHYHDINDTGIDLKLEKFEEIQTLLKEFNR